ncbi:hypothetical protein [Aliarcobacter butzleri]|uniref:hypothetical protein n=1 Tax=Aliarcobacter butzleri TaxID=28197 RepID=UPI00125F10A7|nr:hypothetical protein [Aliarcobacter butzleri]
MKKLILGILLFISNMIADSWVSGWVQGGTSTYEITNDKGDNLKIYCNENYTSIDLNEETSDSITLINKDNKKFVSGSHISGRDFLLADGLALDNFLYEASDNNKFTIIMGKQKAVFNVVKNNVNDEIVKSCNSDKLMEYQNLLNGNSDKPKANEASKNLNADDLYKLTLKTFYNPLLYSNQLLLETTAMIDGLIVYEIKINNGIKGCVWTGKGQVDYYKKKNIPIPYKTLKQFQKESFYFPGGCDVMKIEVFTNKGDFVHTAY